MPLRTSPQIRCCILTLRHDNTFCNFRSDEILRPIQHDWASILDWFSFFELELTFLLQKNWNKLFFLKKFAPKKTGTKIFFRKSLLQKKWNELFVWKSFSEELKQIISIYFLFSKKSRKIFRFKKFFRKLDGNYSVWKSFSEELKWIISIYFIFFKKIAQNISF